MPPISLCMIVRDEAEVLDRCLESARGIADELIVVDTGSADETVGIAKRHGARVETFPWCDDFSAARNASFALATQPYILWLDADDVLLPEDRERLLALKPRLERDVYYLRYDYAQDAQGRSLCLLFRERLVRNRPEIRWRYPVHELLTTGGCSWERADVTVTHRRSERGADADAGRNLRILSAAAVRPEYRDDARVHYYLGRELQDNRNPAGAVQAFRRALDIGIGGDDQAVAWYRLAACHHQLAALEPERAVQHRADARFAARRSRAADPRRAEPYCTLAMVALDEGDPEEAIFWAGRAPREVPDTYVPVDTWAYGSALDVVLCIAYDRTNDHRRSNFHNERALRARPGDANLLGNRSYLRGRLGDAGERPLVVIHTGYAYEPWNGRNVDEGGIGGSETAAARMAAALAALGHRVVVFGDCREETVDGVEYLHGDRFAPFLETHFVDVLVVSRYARLLDVPARAARRFFWMHDGSLHEGDEEPLRRHWPSLDGVLCLSPWHRDVMTGRYGDGKLVLTRNGIDAERFRQPVTRRRNRLIYSSAPDRGLDTLLEIFPRIRGEVPDAELHVFSGADGLERQLAQQGVVHHGRVGQRQLAAEMLASEVWLFPTRRPETYCITALEAQTAGVACVCSNLGALSTTVGERGILLDGDPYDEDYRRRAVEATISLLRDGERRERITAAARAWAAKQTWQSLAREWTEMFGTAS